ncbi:MAG: 50S ribosomal protein L6 [Candidatus Cloacimonadaceae bacterium]|jgi:large subunit ribosomal protein L6|nr:50S ribosomal protein L6 [Candidatus Cloacimonadota bacterium]MDY0127501.1 50S ribosomal protein L6 [Candidatus Cloacimonadaceae bacterium]MCB5254703.1 50S ribosomal protein L6 [Candidatus Cloacimonadota bacterium]MCK9177958.1 50S ribosomal protein L6 [Candidatus Cloacimonadota bacterium]MCK9242360.1 50S ribosomal protein L6 [Candidatus Cloacimonadota bacterium]
MSRIGKAPIKISSDLNVTIADQIITVKGKLGELSYTLMPGMSLQMEDGVLNVLRADDSKDQRAVHGLTRALIQNMVTGVTEGYKKTLHIFGTGYSSEKIGPWLRLTLGYSHDIMLRIPEGLKVESEAVPRSKGGRSDFTSIITVEGIDKQMVGQFAAEIRFCRPPENYKGKGIRYHDEYVAIKAGKAGA